jgi:hypothetical protein
MCRTRQLQNLLANPSTHTIKDTGALHDSWCCTKHKCSVEEGVVRLITTHCRNDTAEDSTGRCKCMSDSIETVMALQMLVAQEMIALQQMMALQKTTLQMVALVDGVGAADNGDTGCRNAECSRKRCKRWRWKGGAA